MKLDREAAPPLALLAFGALALVGLIVLAATHTLAPTVADVLQSLAFASLTGAAGVATPRHAHRRRRRRRRPAPARKGTP